MQEKGTISKSTPALASGKLWFHFNPILECLEGAVVDRPVINKPWFVVKPRGDVDSSILVFYAKGITQILSDVMMVNMPQTIALPHLVI